MTVFLKEIPMLAIVKKLKQGQHETPPKGKPKDRSQYAVPEHYEFPVNDAKHVRAALAYFDKHKWESPEVKRKAAKRILSAAKKFGVEVSEDSNVYRAAHGGEAKKALWTAAELTGIAGNLFMVADSLGYEALQEKDPRDVITSLRARKMAVEVCNLILDIVNEEIDELGKPRKEMAESFGPLLNADGNIQPGNLSTEAKDWGLSTLHEVSP